jgi:hypothetical protein
VSQPAHIYWRRRLMLLGALALVVAGALVRLCSGGKEEPQRTAVEGTVPPPPELPREGRSRC